MAREDAENQNRSQQDKLNAKHRPRQGCAVLVRDVGDAPGSRHAATATMKTGIASASRAPPLPGWRKIRCDMSGEDVTEGKKHR